MYMWCIVLIRYLVVYVLLHVCTLIVHTHNSFTKIGWLCSLSSLCSADTGEWGRQAACCRPGVSRLCHSAEPPAQGQSGRRPLYRTHCHGVTAAHVQSKYFQRKLLGCARGRHNDCGCTGGRWVEDVRIYSGSHLMSLNILLNIIQSRNPKPFLYYSVHYCSVDRIMSYSAYIHRKKALKWASYLPYLLAIFLYI